MLTRFFTVLLILASLIFATACPKAKVESAQKKAASTVYQLSGLVLDLSKATDRAFDEGLLSVETKDKAVDGLRLLNTGVKRLTELTAQIEVNNEPPSPQFLTVINKVLSDEVIRPFLVLLTDYGGIAAEKASYLRTVLSAIRISILTISNAMADAGSPVDTGGLANV